MKELKIFFKKLLKYIGVNFSTFALGSSFLHMKINHK